MSAGRWLVMPLMLAACRRLDCPPTVDTVTSAEVVGLVGERASVSFTESFCRGVTGEPSTFEVFDPDDTPIPVEIDQQEVDEHHSFAVVHFTPVRTGLHYLRGHLSTGDLPIQQFIQVGIDCSGAQRQPFPLPESDACWRAAPFGASGAVCFNASADALEIRVGGEVRQTLSAGTSAVVDDQALWTFSGSEGVVSRWVAEADGGLRLTDQVTDAGLRRESAIISRWGPDAILVMGQPRVRLVAFDGGVFEEKVDLPYEFGAACLIDGLLVADDYTSVGVYPFPYDGGALLKTPGFRLTSCTKHHAWGVATPGFGLVETLGPWPEDGGVASVLTLTHPTQPEDHFDGLPILHVNRDRPGAQSLVPAFRDGGLELEWYGQGRVLWASEREVLLRDGARSWLITRP